MNTQRYPIKLGDLRVPTDLHKKLEAVCKAQNMTLADVRRAALEEYCQPAVLMSIPVIGRIVADEEMGNKVEYFQDAEYLEEAA